MPIAKSNCIEHKKFHKFSAIMRFLKFSCGHFSITMYCSLDSELFKCKFMNESYARVPSQVCFCGKVRQKLHPLT